MTYNDLIALPLDEVKKFATANPLHIGAQNALRTLEEDARTRAVLSRIGKKYATKSGFTRVYRKGKCPRKRDLR